MSSFGAAEHPGLDPAIQNAHEPERSNRRFTVLLTEGLGLQLIRSYFGVYTVGKALKNEPIRGRGSLLAPLVEAFEREWEATRNGYLGEVCRELLSKARYRDFAVALLQQTSNYKKRFALLERYLDACAYAEHPWWLDFVEERTVNAEQSLWKHLSPEVKWMAELFKATGKTLSGLVETRFAAYTDLLKEGHELLEGLYRHEIALSAETVDPSVHYLARIDPERPKGPNYQAHVDLRGGEMIVTRIDAPAEASDVELRLKLLRRVDAESPDVPAGPVHPHAYELATKINASYSRKLVVPIDIAELKQRHTLPKGFARCAEVFNIARAAITIADNLSKDAKVDAQLEPAWDLTKGVIALADSHQAVLKAMQRPLDVATFVKKSKMGAIKFASHAVSAVDAVAKIRKGSNILFSDEGDLEYELQQGRSLRAGLQATKGVLQIAGGIVGLVGALPATAGLAATGLGLVIVVGSGVVSATIDVALDLTQDNTDHVEDFRRAVYAAENEELALRTYRVSACVRKAGEQVKRSA